MIRKLINIFTVSFLVLTFLNIYACEKGDPATGDENSDGQGSVTGYPVAGTGQQKYYNNTDEIIAPEPGEAFFGQNAHYPGNFPSYNNNGDGTVSDLVTGLMWQQSPDQNEDGIINAGDKRTWQDALSGAAFFKLAGYNDWRLPTIKELYSLIMFTGEDPSGYTGTTSSGLVPFINTSYFAFGYGDTGAGERLIDAQFASATLYTGTTMGGNETMFGVNFADGRIKGYPTGPMPGQSSGKLYYVLYVRGNKDYGKNDLKDNGDGTITDFATGLTWMKEDSKIAMNWQEALDYAEIIDFAGHGDWRLPDVKELQSIVDYSRSPDATSSPAIDPLFQCTEIVNEGGKDDYPCYWSNTTHTNISFKPGVNAAYVCFGRAMGYFMNQWMDVHGAGAQRSDPKTGSNDLYPFGHGPQGDAIRGENFVRLVRGGGSGL